MEAAINQIREGRAEYKTQDREAQDGDYINVSFVGTVTANRSRRFPRLRAGCPSKACRCVNADGERIIHPELYQQLVGAKQVKPAPSR